MKLIRCTQAEFDARVTERGADPRAAARCTQPAEGGGILVDITHADYPHRLPPPVAVSPVNGWAGLHALCAKPVANVYGTLAAVYGMTQQSPRTNRRHKQWADILSKDPFNAIDPEGWANRQHNRINKRLGKPLVTIAQARELREPVDLVVTWVDGSDPAWQKRYRQTIGSRPPHGRCTDAGELRALLRSVDRFAPWIRRVWIVSDRQTPPYVVNHPRARVVDHSAFIPAEFLPVFSSHAIEPWLNRIPGLAERFIYGNDDMMFGSPVFRSQFFDPAGRPLIVLRDLCRTGRTNSYGRACANAADALDSLFGVQPWRRGWHHFKPYRRSMMAEAAGKLATTIQTAMAARSRSGKGIAWDHAFWPAYSVASGVAKAVKAPLQCRYVGMDTPGEQGTMYQVREARPHLICVNNSTPANAERVRAFHAAYLGNV